MNLHEMMTWMYVDKCLRIPFMSIIDEYRRLQYLPTETLSKLQTKRLNALLTVDDDLIAHTSEDQNTTDLYAELHKRHIITKRDLEGRAESLARELGGGYLMERSSGSSGQRTEVLMSRAEHLATIAIQTFVWEWSEYRLGAPFLQTGMSLPRSWMKSVKDRLLNTCYVSAFDLSDAAIDRNLERAQRAGVLFIGGYAASLYAHAQRAIKRGFELPLRGIISWGDKLYPHYRAALEAAFGARVTDVYGSTEGFVVAAQCEEGSYHILTPHVYVEIIDEAGRPVPRGTMGRLLLTRLDSRVMPLIRYDIGDIAAFSEHETPCRCGRGFPTLDGLIGRDTDIITTSSGRRMIVHFFTAIFENVPEIQQFQIVQRDQDAIVVRYIPSPACIERTLEHVAEQIRTRLGERISINFEKVERIAPSASGKPQIILREMENTDR